ncbi:MAG: phenylalanine--tRNA ligase subunit alpha, partial [Candidatus Gastranaerophilales bacterium]|nr:phenylalanine--tRNA ligase subunit alpha [Candidatus Gastranaerophilales bacterium]
YYLKIEGIMQEKLENIYKLASADIENSVSLNDLEEVKLKYLSRKGEFNSIKKGLKDLSIEEKKIVGTLANEITEKLETAIKAKYSVLYRKELNAKLQKEKIDITLPGKSIPIGKTHPLTSTTNEIVSIFQNLGFSVVSKECAPEVETEYFNFDMLNVPQDHPARDVQDTFYTKLAPYTVLRSQTSNAQIRAMESMKPPIRIIAPGRVYRNETLNARKNNFFHQIEGLYVDKNITFGDLKGVLNEFIRLYFGSARPTRFRSSFFPFTEPSVEIDVQCIMCEGKGCRTCSGTGWLEVLGAGMVDVNVLNNVGIDPDVYTGFAFGMGVERLAMLKYAIDDIRLFFNNDKRFLEQFKG